MLGPTSTSQEPCQNPVRAQAFTSLQECYLAQARTCLHKHAKACASSCKLAQACRSPAQTCTSPHKLVQACRRPNRLAQACASLRKLAQACTSLDKLPQPCTTLCKLAKACTSPATCVFGATNGLRSRKRFAEPSKSLFFKHNYLTH